MPRTACDAVKNRNTQRMHAKRNTTHAINSMLCVHCVFRVRALRVFFICRMSSMRCVCCVAYVSLEIDLKSIFIGLRAVSKLSYATHATQLTASRSNDHCRPPHVHRIYSSLCMKEEQAKCFSHPPNTCSEMFVFCVLPVNVVYI